MWKNVQCFFISPSRQWHLFAAIQCTRHKNFCVKAQLSMISFLYFFSLLLWSAGQLRQIGMNFPNLKFLSMHGVISNTGRTSGATLTKKYHTGNVTQYQRWAAILKNVSFKAIQSHNFLEKNRLKRYNFVCQKFFHRWSDTIGSGPIFWSDAAIQYPKVQNFHRWSDTISVNSQKCID